MKTELIDSQVKDVLRDIDAELAWLKENDKERNIHLDCLRAGKERIVFLVWGVHAGMTVTSTRNKSTFLVTYIRLPNDARDIPGSKPWLHGKFIREDGTHGREINLLDDWSISAGDKP